MVRLHFSRCHLGAMMMVIAILVAADSKASAVCGDALPDIGETCDDGNDIGGDGCASNCTAETRRLFVIDPLRSTATTQLQFAPIEFGLTGTIVVTTGQKTDDVLTPFVIRAADIQIEKVSIPGLLCACTSSEANDNEFGAGNVGTGGVLCPNPGQPIPEEYALPSTLVFSHDHNTNDEDPDCTRGTLEGSEGVHPTACHGRFQVGVEGASVGEGTMFLRTNLVLRLIRDGGTCSTNPSDPAKGPDGIPCTVDDPSGPDDPAQIVKIEAPAAVTGTVRAEVFNANNSPTVNIVKGAMCGATPCRTEQTGEVLDCQKLLASSTGPVTTGVVVLAFPVLDAKGVGDGVVTVRLVPKGDEPVCPGDCSGDGSVTVGELIQGVNIALGSAPISQCPAFDANMDGEISVAELVGAVRVALDGCP